MSLSLSPSRFLAPLGLCLAVSISGQLGCSSEGTGTPGSGGTPLGAGGGSGGGTPGTGGIFGGGGTTGVGGSSGGTTGVGGGSGGAGAGGASGGSSAGGGSSGGAPGAGGSGTGFSPCPSSGPCKILPLGDSITEGVGFAGGYRVHLFELAHGDGHDVTFTGTQTPNGPNMVDGVTFPRNHAGISGQTIQQIAGRIPTPDLTEVPHIVLLHAGTNDIWNGPSGADGRLGDLIDELVELAPDALIVVSNIVPWPAQESLVATYNAAVPGVVQERIDAGAHVLYVDQFDGFPSGGLSQDGIHPNQTGYAAMAEKWYSAISSYLP